MSKVEDCILDTRDSACVVTANGDGTYKKVVTSLYPRMGEVLGVCMQHKLTNDTFASVIVRENQVSIFSGVDAPYDDVFDQLLYGQVKQTHVDGWYYPRRAVCTVGFDAAAGAITTRLFTTGGEPVVDAIAIGNTLTLIADGLQLADYVTALVRFGPEGT